MPAWFGGIGGVPIDRASGTPWGGWHFGAPVQAYAVIAVWCLASAWAMHALTRTPLARLANAVRDNPVRVTALGSDPRRVRLAMVTCASFFAGVAGTLTLIDVEIATPDSVSMARSATVLIAAVIGGTGAFFGPAAGAAVLTVLSIVVAGVSRAWALYLGVLFVVVVVAAPRRIAGIVQALAQALRRGAPAAERWRMLCAVGACVFWGVAVVCAAENRLRVALRAGRRRGLRVRRLERRRRYAGRLGRRVLRVRHRHAAVGLAHAARAGRAGRPAGGRAMNGNAIALHGVVQRFGAQTVLDGVELSIAAGGVMR